MGTTTDTAKELVDQLADQQQVLAAAQAHHAALMLEFSTTRRQLDQQRITNQRGDGADPRYTAGEFAALEIGLAITASKDSVSRTLGIARRLKDETPDAWDAWQAGHIDQPRAARINKALIRLKFDSSKQLLNVLVVDVAVCKTVELLGRWLNEFIARVEPDQTNERLRRSFEDRYVSIRPDLDGISFLNAAIASADADAINQVLNALAAIAEPGDTPHRCDHDHVIPVPEGPTTAANLNNDCRPEHRAKTHAGHHTSRDGNTTTWTTPTGHTYRTTDQPFPVEQWPTEKSTDSEMDLE